MLNIITSFSLTETENRNEEILYTIKKNVYNDFIKNIYVLTEDFNVSINLPKVSVIKLETRPSFEKLVGFSNSLSDIVAIVNADIFFDNDKIRNIGNIKPGEVYCLTRWYPDFNIDEDNIEEIDYWKDNNARLSFDSYIYRPKICIQNIDFITGVLGCDNRFAYELHNAGLRILNPSKIIPTYHAHYSNIRNYKDEDRLNGNYLRVELTDSLEFNPDNISTGWNEGLNSVYPVDWDWLPKITNEEYVERQDVPRSMKLYFNRDRNGRIRPRV